MPRSLVFFRLFVLTVVLTSGIHLSGAGTRPNFLFVSVDDLNHYLAPLLEQEGHFLQKVYPDPAVRAEVGKRIAPNLDRLKAQSLFFRRAMTPSPLCGPARTALMTGVPAHLTGYYQHDMHFRFYDTLTDAVTLPQYLKANGYYTVGISKLFHKGRWEEREGKLNDWADTQYSWSTWIESGAGTGAVHGERQVTRDPLSPNFPDAAHYNWGTFDIPIENTRDYHNVKFAADLMARGKADITDSHGKSHHVVLPEGEPFFLGCGVFMPHLPWYVPQELLDRFPREEMEGINEALLEWVLEDVKDFPEEALKEVTGSDFDRFIELGEARLGDGGVLELWKSALQAYLASITYADICLGQLIDAYENSPYRDNTIFILWSDHGWHLGEKKHFRKHQMWEAANHCTLMIRDPRIPETTQGLETDALVSLQDLYPTIVKMAGLARPAHIHGWDLDPLLRNPEMTWKDGVLMTIAKGKHSLRTDQYKYIRYPLGGKELYDMKADPFQNINLAALEEQQGLVGRVDKQLNAFLGRSPEHYQDEE